MIGRLAVSRLTTVYQESCDPPSIYGDLASMRVARTARLDKFLASPGQGTRDCDLVIRSAANNAFEADA
jgi:hypothetical protein